MELQNTLEKIASKLRFLDENETKYVAKKIGRLAEFVEKNAEDPENEGLPRAKWIYGWLNQKEYIEVTDADGKVTKKVWNEATPAERELAKKAHKKDKKVELKKKEAIRRKSLEPVHYKFFS
jgi:hypothetical protein